MSRDCMNVFKVWLEENRALLRDANISDSEAAYIFSSGWNERKKHEATYQPSR